MPWNKIRLFAALLALNACEWKHYPSDFVPLYTDLRIASQEFDSASEDGRRLRLQILDRYGYTPSKFDSTVRRLKKDPDQWTLFQNDLMAHLDSMEPAPPPPLKVIPPDTLQKKQLPQKKGKEEK